MSAKDNNEERVIHSKSQNIETMFSDKADFQLFCSRYQIRLETSIKDSDFIFDCVYLLY